MTRIQCQWTQWTQENKTYTERRETLLYYRFHLLERFDRIIVLEVGQVELSNLSDSLGSGPEHCQSFAECSERSI